MWSARLEDSGNERRRVVYTLQVTAMLLFGEHRYPKK
jgi:hypothetical protein